MAMGSSSYRDRTAEFDAVVDRFKINLHGQAPTSSSSSSSTPSSVSNSSSNRFDFNREASRIGLSIQDAEKKLSRLSKLTKRSSMFDDPTREIQELTVVMSQDLTWLNSSIQQLESNDILQSDMSSQNFEHCKTIVENLKGRLMQITSGFKEVLTTRTEHLKVHENRRQLFTAAPASEKSGANALNSSIGNETSSNHTPPPWAKSLSSQTPISRYISGVILKKSATT